MRASSRFPRYFVVIIAASGYYHYTLLDVAKYYKQFSTTNLVEKTHKRGTPWDSVYQKGKNNLIDKMTICAYFKKEAPLDSFVVPKYLYDTAYNGERNDNGVLILPREL